MDYLARVQILCAKLSGNAPEGQPQLQLATKIRCLDNLTFKLRANIFPRPIDEHLLKIILKTVGKCLADYYSNADESNGPSDHAKYLELNLCIIEQSITFSRESISISDIDSSNSHVESLECIFENIIASLQRIRSKLLSIGFPVDRTSDNAFFLLSEKIPHLIEQTINRLCSICPPPIRAAAETVSSPSANTAIPNIHADVSSPVPKKRGGAGAIIYSDLVQIGWKLPAVVLVDKDDRFLFELETKLKLGHATVRLDLDDAMADFPAAVLLRRPVLLATILDVLGGPALQEETYYGGDLTSHYCLRWMSELLQKARRENLTQAEGSLFSSYGCERVRAAPPTSEEYFPAEMAHAMQSLRYPNLFIHGEEVGTGSGDEVNFPSLSGLAFACVAASLPLLQGQVNSMASEVLRLALVALPLVLEPVVRKDREAHAEVNYRRVQHLLNRMEQLLTFFDSLGTSFIPADMLRFSCTVDSDVDGMSAGSFQTIFLGLYVRVMHLASLLTFSREDSASLPQPYAMCFLELLGPAGTVPLRPPRGDKVRSTLLLLGQRCFDCAVTVLVQQNCFSVLFPVGDSTSDILLGILLKAKGSPAVSQVDSARTLARSVLNLLSIGPYDSPDVKAQLLQDCCTVSPLLCHPTLTPVLSVDTGKHDDNNLDINGLFNSVFVFLVHSLGDSSGGIEESRHRTAAVLHSILLRCICAKETEAPAETLSSHVVDSLDRFLSDPAAFISTIGSSLQVDVVLNSTTPLLALLANPAFLHCMVMHSCNSAKAPGFLSCVRVTDALCDYAVRYLRVHYQVGSDDGESRSAWMAWHKLLCPLQILLWICEEEQDIEESSQQGIRGFLEYLQKAFESSSDVALVSSCRRSQLLGLFHRRQQVRVHAALNLFRVFGLPIKLTERADLNIFDPFFGDNLVDSDLPLEDIKKEIVVQAPAKTATEVRNLGKMCFGNLDVSIRLIAFQQLSAALSAASNSLFNTLQKDWFLLLAQDCMETLMSFLRRLGDSELVRGVTDSDCSIAQAAASLLRGLGQRSIDLRRAFSFYLASAANNNSSQLYADLSVKNLLSVLFHFSRASGQVGSPFHTTLRSLASECLQLLSYLVCHSSEWTVQFPEQSMDITLSDSVKGLDALTCPSFLLFILRLPNCGTDESQLVQPDLPRQRFSAATLGFWDSSAMEEGVVAPRDLVELAIRDLHCRPKEEIFSLLSQKIFDLLAHAKSHRELKRVVDLTECWLLSCDYGDLLSGLIVQELNPFRALGNIVTTLPKTRKDYTSLILSLRLLHNMFKLDNSNSHSSHWDIRFISESLEGVVEGFSQYFRSNSFSASQEKHHHPDLPDGDYQRVNSACQQSFLQLLGTLMLYFRCGDNSSTDSSAAIRAILPPGAFMFSLIVHIAITESFPTTVRKTALTVLESAVAVIGPQVLLETNPLQSEQFTRTLPSSIGAVDGLIRAVKSLRHSDTFQGNCLLTASLKVMLIHVRHMTPLASSAPELSGSKDEDDDVLQRYNNQWGWVRVFLYHRQSTVKLMATHIVLSLVSKVIKYRHFERSDEGQLVWPPYEQLSHLVGDTYECKAVRVAALRALAHCVHHYSSDIKSTPSPSGMEVRDYSGPMVLGPVLQCVADVLAWSSPAHRLHASCEAIGNALLSLRLLLTSSSGQVYTNNLLLMRSMKIFALVTETFHSDFKHHMLEGIYSRLQLQLDSNDRSAIPSSWIDFSQVYKDISTQENVVRLYASQVMLSLLRIDRVLQSDLFLQSITYTATLPSIISYQWMRETDMESIEQLRLRLCGVAGLFNIMSEALVIPDDSSSARVRSKLRTVPEWQQKLISTATRFTAACLLLPLDGTAQVEVETGILTSALRLLSCMVGDDEWQAQRRRDDDPAVDDSIFQQLLSLRRRLVRFSVYTRVGQQLDTVLALFMQQSRGGRAGLSAATNNDFHSILTQSISDVVSCSQLLPSAAAVASPSAKNVKTKGDKNTDDKWRKKARSYQVNRTNSAASQLDLIGDDLLSVKDKQRIMTALVFLTCTLPSSPEIVELAIQLDLHNALNILFRYARRHAVKPLSSAAVADVPSSKDWRPSSGMVAAAVLAALSAFLAAPTGKSRQVFSLAGIPNLTLVGRDDVTASSALHQLWAAGLGYPTATAITTASQNRGGMYSAGRRLSLRLLSSLLAEGGSGQVCTYVIPSLVQHMQDVRLSGRRIWTSREGEQSFADLSSWLHLLSSLLLSSRSGLHAYTQLQETMQPILDILRACLTISPDTHSHSHEDGGEVGDTNFAKWDHSSYSSWRMLRAAALRCVCALCQVDRLSAEEVEGRVMNRLSATTSVLNSGLCEVIVQVLYDSKKSSALDGVEKTAGRDQDGASDGAAAMESSLAVVGLWCLVHQSERAKAMVRRQLEQLRAVVCPSGLLLATTALSSGVEEEDAEEEDEDEDDDDGGGGDGKEFLLDPRILRRAWRCAHSLLRP